MGSVVCVSGVSIRMGFSVLGCVCFLPWVFSGRDWQHLCEWGDGHCCTCQSFLKLNAEFRLKLIVFYE
jgi:hypothetical protein